MLQVSISSDKQTLQILMSNWFDYADSNLEVNQGFCNNNDIQVGDKIYKS